ncbi:UNVERIFIED_CONTAM: hypothetical protein Sindi_0824000 [Sesamum indicum]
MWSGEGECENSRQVMACPMEGRARRRRPPSQLEAAPRAGGARPPFQPEAVPRAGGCGAEAPPSGDPVLRFGRGEFLDFIPPVEKVWDDLPPYLEGYSPDHVAAIMSLPKCPSFDSGENLEDLSDFELDSTGFRRSEQCADIASDGEAGSERCETDDEVVSEDEETESEGEEVENDSEAEITKVSARPSVVVVLGVDWRRPGVPGYCIPHCRMVDIVLATADPPAECFTVYTSYLDNGFSIPPHPLLFKGWKHRLLELGLPLTLESFHALWTVRRMVEVSVSSDDGRYFYFTPQKAFRFLEGFVFSKGPWKEIFFFIRDDGWGLASEWSSSPIKITHLFARRVLFHSFYLGFADYVQIVDVTSSRPGLHA